MTQAEITMQTLRKIGFEGNDLTELKDQVAGREIPVTIKSTEKDGRVFFNIQYIGAGGEDHPQEIDAATMKSRLSALFGGAADATAQKPAAAPAAAKPSGNPFAKQPAAGGGAAAAPGKATAGNPFAAAGGKSPFG
jgi:hypothetical protein